MINIKRLKYKTFKIEKTKIYLKLLNTKDVNDNYVKWLNNYDVVKFTDQKFIKHDIEVVINFVEEKYNSNNDLLFGIFFDSYHIGNIKLGPIDFIHKVSDVSYFIGEKEYWGKGIATLIIKKIIQIAFDEIKLEKVTAGCHINNIASKKALEKNKFISEGTRFKQFSFENKRVDQLLFGINKH